MRVLISNIFSFYSQNKAKRTRNNNFFSFLKYLRRSNELRNKIN